VQREVRVLPVAFSGGKRECIEANHRRFC